MTDYEYIKTALTIARTAHANQMDKSGIPYIYHPITVSLLCNSLEEKLVALLHDVIEDTEVTLTDLRAYSFPDAVYEALPLLTHKGNSISDADYRAYIMRIKESGNQIAINVKLADLTHNTDLSRTGGNKTKKYDTYLWAIKILKE